MAAAISEFGMVNPLPDLDWEEEGEELDLRLMILDWRIQISQRRPKTTEELIEGMRRRTEAYSPKYRRH